MTLNFGLTLDERCHPTPTTLIDTVYVGANGLVQLLEQAIGLPQTVGSTEHLRTEQYRQVLEQYLTAHKTAYFAASFAADALATATAVLVQRDELVATGLLLTELAPEHLADAPRIATLADIERESQASGLPIQGFADRVAALIHTFSDAPEGIAALGIDSIQLNEMLNLLPLPYRILFAILQYHNIKILDTAHGATVTGYTDIHQFQRRLLRQANTTAQQTASIDGSLLLIHAKRDTDAADYLATVLRQNPILRPLLLIPEKDRTIENALLQEGLPALGILSASLARPTLQILKLAASFLWRPIDPYKILEFLTLPIKPLRDDLALRLAAQMAAEPGLDGEKWYAIVEDYFAKLGEKAILDPSLEVRALREQYNFWFTRRRYDTAKPVPRSEVIDVFGYVQRWARKTYDETNAKYSSLLVLSEQAKRIKEVLEALPERVRDLSYLQIERLVRTLYQPSPVQLEQPELHGLDHIYSEAGIIAPVATTVWWNFGSTHNEHFFARWYKPEFAIINALLQQKYAAVTADYTLDTPERESACRLWQRSRPALLTTETLVLIIPEKVVGSELLEHPLLSELKANFSNWSALVVDIDAIANGATGATVWTDYNKENLSSRALPTVPALLQLADPDRLLRRSATEKIYFTALDALLYYPYQYVFKHHLRLKKSTILSISPDNTLKGKLAHRIFEGVLTTTDDISTVELFYAWIDRRLFTVLNQEGATLLLYGREPERAHFVQTVKRSAWVFCNALRRNNWTVLGTEYDLTGTFDDLEMGGRTDVVLQNTAGERCIIDLKWRGANYRSKTIANEKELQLVLYSKLLMQQEGKPNDWAHAAYYIIESEQFIARNTSAFSEAIVPPKIVNDHHTAYNAIYKRMIDTYRWRSTQLQEGAVEVRTTETLAALDQAYIDAAFLLELLELPSESAKFDDFGTLVK